jgi:hypothetical protein
MDINQKCDSCVEISFVKKLKENKFWYCLLLLCSRTVNFEGGKKKNIYIYIYVFR